MVDGKNSLYNEDELHPPSWLNDDFFLQVLRKHENLESINIKFTTITPGTTKSDHYASIMFRIKINYSVVDKCGMESDKIISMILKTTPQQEGTKKEMLHDMKLFETEIKMCTETLPRFQTILREIGDRTILCAKTLYYSLEPNQCIIFEDLVEKGYSTISNRACTMEEVKEALLKLAKLHAVSYKLAQEGDTEVTGYLDGPFNKENLENFDFIKNAPKIFKELLDEHDDLRQYIPYIERVEKNFVKKINKIFNAYQNGERSGIQVLNHGDFHMKNMMVKVIDENLRDLMLLDYQISIFGSSAIDVLYSIIMLMGSEMRRYNLDELLYYYFMNFQNTLRILKYSGRMPTMTEFRQELWKHRHFELFLFITFIIMNYIFTNAGGDLQGVVENETYRKELLRKPEVLKDIRYLLPQYVHKGYFEE